MANLFAVLSVNLLVGAREVANNGNSCFGLTTLILPCSMLVRLPLLVGAYHLFPSLATASGVCRTVILRKKDCFFLAASLYTKTGITGAAKTLCFLADEFLDSDYLAFALIAGVACQRGWADFQQHFEMKF